MDHITNFKPWCRRRSWSHPFNGPHYKLQAVMKKIRQREWSMNLTQWWWRWWQNHYLECTVQPKQGQKRLALLDRKFLYVSVCRLIIPWNSSRQADEGMTLQFRFFSLVHPMLENEQIERLPWPEMGEVDRLSHWFGKLQWLTWCSPTSNYSFLTDMEQTYT